MPTLIDQKRNTRSMGSLIAVRNLTIDKAPTIPSEITMLDWIVKMIAAVIIAMAGKDILKFLL